MKECEWHRLVDSKWQKLEQELGSLHIPTKKQAINGVKRLYRHIMKKPFEGRVEVAKKRNQRTWIRYKTTRFDGYSRTERVLTVSPKYQNFWHSGWSAIIHDLSHCIHREKNPTLRPHHHYQLRIEKEMTDYAIKYEFHKSK